MNAPFKHDQAKPITYRTPDMNGDVPDITVLGRRYRHTGNQKSYRVNELVFLADVDKWAYSMVEKDGDIPIIRTHRNFFGRRSNGLLRFEALRS